MKREKMLTIRVTDEEHARLLERCEGKRLAEWMRRVCLGSRLHAQENCRHYRRHCCGIWLPSGTT